MKWIYNVGVYIMLDNVEVKEIRFFLKKDFTILFGR